jgi:hypothetical protein
VLSKAPLGALVGAGVLGTGLLATAVLLPTPPAGGAQRDIATGNRAALHQPAPDTAAAATTSANNTDQAETAQDIDTPEQVDAPDETASTFSQQDKAPEAASEGNKPVDAQTQASANETKAKAPTAAAAPKAEATTYMPVALNGYTYTLLLPKGSTADVRTLPQLTLEMKPLGGWWQTGAGKPHLVLASRTRQQVIPGSTQHPDAEATRVVRIGKVRAMQYVVALPEGGYGVEYWLFSGEGFELCKVYDPRAFDSVRAALASKPLFRVS